MRHAIAVVVVTTCRQSLLRAVRSVYAQKLEGAVQVLIGVDCDPGARRSALMALLDGERPPHITLTLVDPGYSTSQRHGGPHTSYYGGSLRSALTLLADSRVVTYLDDDDWFKDDHCARILHALAGKKWAWSYSIYADGNTGEALCVDEIESVGVGRGIYAKDFGGFVRPSGLAIDKLQLLPLVHLWSCAAFPTGDGEDRMIFSHLRNEPHGCTDAATVCCALDPRDGMHAVRTAFMRSKGVVFPEGEKKESTR
ncbi:MAG: glycosyltransferase family 2 protein [Burkholderiales bacterium]|nr:glycosyltransferase family 2 protein [Burkholderiales bacterium]